MQYRNFSKPYYNIANFLLSNKSIADLGGQIFEKDDGELDQKIIKEISFETKKEIEKSKENGVYLKKLVNGKIIMIVKQHNIIEDCH